MLKSNGEIFNIHAGDALFPGDPGYDESCTSAQGSSEPSVSDFHGAFGAPYPHLITTPSSDTESE